MRALANPWDRAAAAWVAAITPLSTSSPTGEEVPSRPINGSGSGIDYAQHDLRRLTIAMLAIGMALVLAAAVKKRVVGKWKLGGL